MQKIQIVFLVTLCLFGALTLCKGECLDNTVTTDCKADFSAIVECANGVFVKILTTCVLPAKCVLTGTTPSCTEATTTTTAETTTTTTATTTSTTTTTTTASATTTTTASSTTTTAVTTTTAAPVPKPITCSGTDFFPDPFNCRYFHDCRGGTNLPSRVMKCFDGYAYYAPGNKCMRSSYDSDCITIKCGSSKVKMPYYPYSYYYTDCGSVTPTMYRCSSSSQYFSTGANACVF